MSPIPHVFPNLISKEQVELEIAQCNEQLLKVKEILMKRTGKTWVETQNIAKNMEDPGLAEAWGSYKRLLAERGDWRRLLKDFR